MAAFDNDNNDNKENKGIKGKRRVRKIKNYERIAAGEVIERPASVVKELVENSIDAGADMITIIIENYGKSLIQVIDNGCGISFDDVEVAFESHTSSKITSADDLNNLSTLGFRGEALYSIAAISKIELITKTEDDDYGTKLRIEGGKVISKERIGATRGTNIKVMDIFYNTPVRYKFLKSNKVELGWITDVVMRYILAYPQIHFKLVHNSNVLMDSPKSSKYINAIFDVYGKDVVKNLKEFKYEDETMDFIKIHGFLGDPSIARSTPLSSSLFVNNRYVTSPLIQKAMQEAYKDYIMVKKYPFYILFLYIKPDIVDFNIHPTKKIIRFANEQKLLSTLVNILKKEVEEKFGQSQSKIKSIGQLREAENVLTDSKDILESHGTTLHGGRLPLKKEIALIREGSKRSGVRSWQKEFRVLKGNGNVAEGTNQIIKTEIVNDNNIKEGKFGKPQSTTHELRLDRMYNIDIEGVPIGEEGGNEIATSGNKGTLKNRGPSDANSGTSTAATMTLKSGLYPETLSPQKISLIRNQYIDTNGVFPKMRLINEAGQLNKLYIIFEGEDGFFILDQHAAAERIRYEEELNAYKSGKLEKQALLLPIMIEVPPNETEFIKANLKELEKFGFRLDFMGGNSFAVRSVPVVFGRIEDKEIIKDICLEIVSMGKEDSFSDEVDKIIKYIACHRSLRGGAEITNPIKSINLLKRLAQCENPHHCAHGRPTMLFITWDELEKLFHRK